MVLNYEGRIKRGECISLESLILGINSHYQNISSNILTSLCQLFMKFMLLSGKLKTRELKWG